MLRRVFNSLLEGAMQTETTASAFPNPFCAPETLPLGWLANVAPCFRVNSNHIEILSEPHEFFTALKNGCESATSRIYLASLYLGTGELETSLVKSVMSNKQFANGKLKLNVLLDFMRGSRFENNSRTMLQPLLKQSHNNCSISFYHTPLLRGLMKKFTPDRWNELMGLQHMKLYIFDDTLVISGANLSNDYFTNRQDRYFVIRDRKLTDFYCGLIDRVQKFSLKLDKENNVQLSESWTHSPYQGDKSEFVQTAGDLIEEYLIEARNENNAHKEEGYDTWIFPLVQMGQLGIEHDSKTTDRLFASAPPNSTLCIATGYFNLTKQYMSTLIGNSQANCKILMAHPQTNGFLGAKGPAGGIPYAYSLIAYQFEQEFLKFNQEDRIGLFEYLRQNWTYHGKGLWYYPADNSKLPCLTLIGSPNFGERSVKRDLETQLAIVTENAGLKQKLHEECQRLYRFGERADTLRDVPKWVHGFVYFFRNYF